MKDVVHKPLKCLSSVAEAVGHVEVLIKAKGNHSRFGNVRRINRNLVVSLHQIKL